MSNWLSLIDPDRARDGISAFVGAVIYGVFTLVTLFMTGQHVSRKDMFRALLNVSAAAITGTAAAVVTASTLTLLIPFAHLRDTATVAFFIGALTWELLPFLFLAARNRARREAEKQAGGGQ